MTSIFALLDRVSRAGAVDAIVSFQDVDGERIVAVAFQIRGVRWSKSTAVSPSAAESLRRWVDSIGAEVSKPPTVA